MQDDKSNCTTDMNRDDVARTGRSKPNIPGTRLWHLQILAQEPGGEAYRPAHWARDEPEDWTQYKCSRRREHGVPVKEDHVQHSSSEASMPGIKRFRTDGSRGTGGIKILAKALGGSREAKELTHRFKRKLKELNRTFRYDGKFFRPNPKSRSYGGPGWFRQNREEIESLLAEGLSVDEVWETIEEALSNPEYGHQIYNMWQIRRTRDTQRQKLLRSAEESAREWYNVLPETLRRRRIEKHRQASILWEKRARRAGDSEEWRRCSHEARAHRDRIVEIREEKLPPLSKTPAGRGLIGIRIEPKPYTYTFNDWGDQSAQAEVADSTFHGLFPGEQKILRGELLALLPDCDRHLVKGRVLDQMKYRELKEEYGVPISTAERRIKKELKSLRSLLEGDGMVEAS